MTNIAFLFPGQGSQRVGMGKELLSEYPEIAGQYFGAADEALGFQLSRLCFEGPEEELVKTENQQPAIFLVSVVIHAILIEAGLAIEASAGHSLGEYSALTAAGAFDFETALRLTRRRGEMMAEVGAQGGIMAAVLGLSSAEVEAVCGEASQDGVVEVANYNSPGQTVISGEHAAVTRAMALLRERGAKRVIQLPVSAPFHCCLMTPLAERFEPLLETAATRDAEVPVVANVTADWEHEAAEIRRNLVTQIAAPVRWNESINRLIDAGYDTFIEVGPGKVLTGLMRSIDPNVTSVSTNDRAGIDKVLSLTSAP